MESKNVAIAAGSVVAIALIAKKFLSKSEGGETAVAQPSVSIVEKPFQESVRAYNAYTQDVLITMESQEEYPKERYELEGPPLPPGLEDELVPARLDAYPGLRYSVTDFWNRTKRYNQFIWKYAGSYSVPNNLIRAVIKVESDGVYNVTGSAGEIGLMQLMYSTAQFCGYRGTKTGLYDPDTNIKYGTAYLRYQAVRYGMDVEDVLASYNSGTVFRWRKDTTPLEGLKLDVGLSYGTIIRINGKYDKSKYGKYYNQQYVDKAIKWYSVFQDVIITKA